MKFGGVAILFRNSVKAVERPEFNVPGLEATWVEMCFGSKQILVGAVYINVNQVDQLHLLDSVISRVSQSHQSFIVGMDATVPKMELVGSATNYLSFDVSNFDIKLSEGLELDATNIELSSTQASMSLGEGMIKIVGASTSFIQIGAANSITLKDDGTDRFLVVGSKSSFTHFDQSTAGVILGTDGGTTKFEAVGDSNNYISFNGSSFDVKSSTYDLDATTIKLQSANSGRIMVGNASAQRVTISGSDGLDSF